MLCDSQIELNDNADGVWLTVFDDGRTASINLCQTGGPIVRRTLVHWALSSIHRNTLCARTVCKAPGSYCLHTDGTGRRYCRSCAITINRECNDPTLVTIPMFNPFPPALDVIAEGTTNANPDLAEALDILYQLARRFPVRDQTDRINALLAKYPTGVTPVEEEGGDE